MTKKLFITGTGTDVGKTFISALLLKKLKSLGKNAAYYKAAMSGNTRDPHGELVPSDSMHVKKIAQLEQNITEMCPYVYEHAFSPHLAAKIEQYPIEKEKIFSSFNTLCQQYEYVVMEGSGGITCPIRYDETQQFNLADLVQALALPSLIIADAGLGTINSVALTADYMLRKNLPIKGIILNRFQHGNVLHEDNLYMCEKITQLKVIACVPENADHLELSEDALDKLFNH